MTAIITVEGKVLGQKRPVFTGWRIAIPPGRDTGGDRLRLRDLIALVVIEEVEAFHQRQEERRLARLLTRAEIEQAAIRGKVDPGEHEVRQNVDPQAAIDNALQSFEDGLYYVFIDGVQQAALDDEVLLKFSSQVTFIRLVALIGG